MLSREQPYVPSSPPPAELALAGPPAAWPRGVVGQDGVQPWSPTLAV